MNLSNIAHIPKLQVLPEFYYALTKTWIKDPGPALMETKPIQVYTNENR